MDTTTSHSKPSSSNQNGNRDEFQKELQSLKDDLVTMKRDFGRFSQAAMHKGQEYASGVKQQAGDQFDRTISQARGYVQERPLTSTLVTLGVGVIAGLVLFRR